MSLHDCTFNVLCFEEKSKFTENDEGSIPIGIPISKLKTRLTTVQHFIGFVV